MPQWGRPPAGATSERRRREWMQWEAHNRVEEIESDEDERLRAESFAGDKLHFTGYDLGSARRDPRDLRYEEQHTYEDEYEVDGEEFDDGGQWQLAMRQKEEELVDKALRRINRARISGESEVDLSREEIDALERRQLIPQSNKPPRPTPPAAPAKGPPKPKRRSAGGFLGFGAPASKPKSSKSSERRSLPVESSPRRGSPEYSPPLAPASQIPAGYPLQPSNRPSSSPSKPTSRSGLRIASGPNVRMPEPPAFRPTSSSRGSPTRSLPDDPNWIPRSKSSSTAQLVPAGADPFAYQVDGPPQYIQGRRNISGPATVSYSSLRRTIARPGEPARTPSGSGLSQEVMERSSEEDVDDDDDDEDESDEGVAIDMVPESSASGYIRGAPPIYPPARARRSRR